MSNDKGVEAEVRTLSGRVVKKKAVGSAEQFHLNINGVSGVYLVDVVAEGGKQTTLRVVNE